MHSFESSIEEQHEIFHCLEVAKKTSGMGSFIPLQNILFIEKDLFLVNDAMPVKMNPSECPRHYNIPTYIPK